MLEPSSPGIQSFLTKGYLVKDGLTPIMNLPISNHFPAFFETFDKIY